MNDHCEFGRAEGEERNQHGDRGATHIHYGPVNYGPVNNVGRAENCNFGENNGTLIQTRGPSPRPGSSSGAHGQEAQRQEAPIARPLNLSGSRQDILALLNPILDASHTRNRKVSGPNSACFPGTRKKVLKKIRTWVNSSILLSNPHIMWIYGYAGCGKSAIALAICKHFADQGRLAAAFFFFRGAGDRSGIIRFATTVASQVAAAIPATAPLIEAAIKANPGLLSTETASLSDQFEQLVYQPINSVKWNRLASALRNGPYLIVLDGLDECRDHEEIAALIQLMITFFERMPSIPLRFLITSRVENHIHQLLHSSTQVKLLNLVEHTSDADISAALEITMAEKMRSCSLAYDPSWPSPEDKAKLVKHIGGSYIFLTTIVKLLFDPYIKDGLTPMERLPLILDMQPDFDGLYQSILAPSQGLPHFQDIISTIALAQESLSVSQIADLLDIKTVKVAPVLMNFHAIMQIPGDDHTPITLWHTSLRDFLCSVTRSGPLHASPTHHRHLAYRCITLSVSSSPPLGSPIIQYSQHFALDHWMSFLQVIEDQPKAFHLELDKFTVHLRTVLHPQYPDVAYTRSKQAPHAPNKPNLTDLRELLQNDTDINYLFAYLDRPSALEMACQVKNWEAVRSLVDAGRNVNSLFYDAEKGIVTALQAACYSGKWDMIYFLLDKGADPNIASPMATDQLTWKGRSGFDDGAPLAFAAWKDNTKLVTRLLDCGANPNLQAGYFNTALQAACFGGSLEIVNLLLNSGADPNLQGGYWESALHACTFWYHDGYARALLKHKADPNIQGYQGWTPLHLACYWGRSKTVECLLEFNVDTSIRDNRGRTALQLARSEREKDIEQILLQHGIVE